MARLSDEQKRFLVRRLACFVAAKTVQAEFKAEYETEIGLEQVCSYDGTTAHGRERLGPDLQLFFDEVRQAYITDEEAVPIAHRAYRLNQMMQLLSEPHIRKNPKAFLAILEQAAKERGGFFEKAKPDTSGDTDTLAELRRILGAPKDAEELGSQEAAEREAMRKRQQAEARDKEQREAYQKLRQEQNGESLATEPDADTAEPDSRP